MYRVIACLTEQHDSRLVVLAAFICVASAFTAFWLLPLATEAGGRRRQLLILLISICTAGGIWATHFVAMLAYDAGMPVSYDMKLTAASFLVAGAANWVGFSLVATNRLGRVFAGGLIIGCGIAAMHFTGIAAIMIPGKLSWDPALVANSIGAGMLITALSTLSYAMLTGRLRALVPPALLTLGICAMHFTAMSAATVTLDPAIVVKQSNYANSTLAISVAVVTMLLMFGCVTAAILQRFTIARGLMAFGSVLVAALAISITVGGYTMEQIRIGGANYNLISASKEMIADILPPPSFIVESYLEARLVLASPESVNTHKARLRVLRGKYEVRKSYWAGASGVPDGFRSTLTHTSDEVVQQFWTELDTNFLPAVDRGETKSANKSLAVMGSLYEAHRRIIDGLVSESYMNLRAIEGGALAQGNLLRNLVISSTIVLFALISLAVLLLRRYVTTPMLATSNYLSRLANGDFETHVPYLSRTDEIGTMANAIEHLRNASVEKIRLEGEMVKKGKLAQLGQLTATVAHEIRNPLGAVKTAAFLIERKTRDKNLGIENPLQRVNNGIARCDKIITELLDFTRTKALSVSSQSIDGWVQAAVAEERKNIPSQVRITCDFGIGNDPVQFDTARMGRVMINLLSNAVEAMVGKGQEDFPNATPNPEITVTTRLLGGNIEISVADNGPGISEENIKKIREPLFTTKSFGVGLGIPAIENILEQHGGGLRIESKIGNGATLTAWFPLTKALETESKTAKEAA